MGVNYYCRFPGDYGRDTRHLSLAEHGAYCLLLDAYYSTGKALPAQIDALVRIVGAQGKAEREAVESVANQFLPVGDDGLRHQKKADEELAYMDDYVAKQARKGIRSGEVRRGNKTNHGSTTVQPRFNRSSTEVRTGGGTEREPEANSPSPSPSPSPNPTPSPPPESVKPTKGRGGIAWSGSVLVVDGEAHAQFRRLYEESWLLEQYPQIDVKLAVLSTTADPWGSHRALGYATTWLTRAKASEGGNGNGKCSAAQRDKYAHLEEKC